MKNLFQWYSPNRENLADFTVGREGLKKYLIKADKQFLGTSASGIAVGLTSEGFNEASAALFVVSDSNYFDLFSWVHTFLPDAFPLSQFARVIFETDARNLRELVLSEGRGRNRSEQWSSIVLGELLGQGGAENDVASVPFSRAAACYSTAVARTWMLYDSEAAVAIATKRLRKIEGDNRFVRRSVTLHHLDAIWEVLNQLGDSLFGENPEAIVSLVCRAAAELHGGAPSSILRLFSLENFAGLRSTSVEERVVTFQRLVADIKLLDSAGEYPALAAIVAGAVFLVGKGTSHSFLLKRVPDFAPAASAWFGLMAALAGPVVWDSHWHRSCKGIEKIIRQSFEWGEPALADLAWPEYDWMASVFDGRKMFEAVSRTVAKVLSIEVMPGAICQLRLAGSPEDVGESPRNVVEASRSPKKEKELEASLVQFLELAEKIQDKLKLRPGSPVDGTTESQSALFEGDKYLSSKPPRKRRNPNY